MSPVLVIRIGRIFRTLRKRGATSLPHAVPLAEVPYHNRWYFRRLVKTGAVRLSGDLCYLDEEGVARYQRQRIWRALAFTALALVGLMLYLVLREMF